MMNVESREGGALLSAHAEGGAHDSGGGALQVGAGGDDAGVLAAHLCDTRSQVPTGLQLQRDLSADIVGAGKGHAGGERMIHERGADRGARAAQVVEYASWQAGIADAVREQPSRPGGR